MKSFFSEKNQFNFNNKFNQIEGSWKVENNLIEVDLEYKIELFKIIKVDNNELIYQHNKTI